MDYAHDKTDKDLKKLERKINKEYTQAVAEMQEKIDNYLADFKRKDEKEKEKVRQGVITERDYLGWRVGQIAIGKRWQEMKDTLAEDLYNTDKIARSMAREFSYDAYALNHNYGTFEVEKGSMIDTSYTLYDRQTVERLVRDDPDLLLPPGRKVSEAIRRGETIRWNKQHIQSVMLQSILQGESIPKIAKRLAKKVGDSNRSAAIRNARTMTTGAENAGRVNSYKRAKGMGINMTQTWIATLDGRTRHTHRILDGESVEVGEKFSNGCRFPGDPDGAPSEVYNCRCTLIGNVAGYEDDLTDLSLRDSRLGTMTYEEWKGLHSTNNGFSFETCMRNAYGTGYTTEQMQEIKKIYDSMPNFLKPFYIKYGANLQPNLEIDKRGVKPRKKIDFGFYRNSEGRVHFMGKRDAQGTIHQFPYELGCHEYGHNMDYLAGTNGVPLSLSYRDKQGRSFSSIIEKDIDTAIRKRVAGLKQATDKDIYKYAFEHELRSGGTGARVMVYKTLLEWRQLNGISRSDKIYWEMADSLGKIDTEEEYRAWFMDNYDIFKDHVVKNTEKQYMKEYEIDGTAVKTFCDLTTKGHTIKDYGCLSDIMENYSINHGGTAYPMGIGHGKAYSSKPGAVGTEAFAEMIESVLVNPGSLEMIKEVLPNAYNAFEEMIKEASK